MKWHSTVIAFGAMGTELDDDRSLDGTIERRERTPEERLSGSWSEARKGA